MKRISHTFAKAMMRINICAGRNNAITRSELRIITGLDDRTNRKIIDELRLENMPIVSFSDAKGYWLPTHKSELQHYINEFRKRASECNRKADIAEEWQKDHESELIDDL